MVTVVQVYKLLLKLFLLSVLLCNQFFVELLLLVVAALPLSFVLGVTRQKHRIVVVFLGRLLELHIQRLVFIVEVSLLLEQAFALSIQIKIALVSYGFVLFELFVQVRVLLTDGFDLCLKNKLVRDDLEVLLLEFVLVAVKVAAHLSVLGFQKLDVLVGGLVVVEEGANPGVLLVLNDLLLQNLEFELHEVDLLLKVEDVVVVAGFVDVVVGAGVSLVLAAELHLDRGLVVGLVAQSVKLACHFL